MPDPIANVVMGFRCPKCRQGRLYRSTKPNGPALGWVECDNDECAFADTIQKVMDEMKKWIEAGRVQPAKPAKPQD